MKMLKIAAVILFALTGSFAWSAETIKIGLINETTGPNAEAGSYAINGVKTAIEQINKKRSLSYCKVDILRGWSRQISRSAKPIGLADHRFFSSSAYLCFFFSVTCAVRI